jgi:hypothetical protein
MAKPIFVLYLTTKVTAEQNDRILNHLREIGFDKDYYFFMINDAKENKCQLFSDKEIDPIEIEELKKIINDERI